VARSPSGEAGQQLCSIEEAQPLSKLWVIVGVIVVAAVVAVGLYLNFTSEEVTVTQAAQPETPAVDLTVKDDELTYGEADAPVTIVEYASLTCPHCADFHINVLPELKSEYFDTGKARLLYRDFPLDQLALRAAVMVRCAAPERQKPLLDVLFKTQENWARAQEPLEAVARIGRAAGMTDETLEACFNNQQVVDGVIAERLQAEQEYQISSTPSFIIDGKVYRGGMSAEEMGRIVEDLTP